MPPGGFVDRCYETSLDINIIAKERIGRILKSREPPKLKKIPSVLVPGATQVNCKKPVPKLSSHPPIHGRKGANSHDGCGITARDERLKDEFATRAADLMTIFGENSKVWADLSALFTKRDNSISDNFKHALKTHCLPTCADSLKNHICVAERLANDLADYGLEPYVWTVEAIYTVFLMRAGEGNVKPSTFQNILYTVRFLRNLFGLDEKVCFQQNDSTILDKYAKNWKLGTEVRVCRAKAIPAFYIAELEKIVVFGEIRHNFSTPVKISFAKRVWAWILRVIIGAGLRWSDALYTPPGSARLSADGMIALGSKNKTHRKTQARPWAVSNFALVEAGWLEKGFELFRSIQNHDSRDFWIGNSLPDESGFDDTPCSYDGASYFLRKILSILGVPESEVSAYRPHSLKASLMSAAVHLQALEPSALSDLELSLLGDWKPDTARLMALQYTREKQILQMRATKKVMMSLVSNKVSQEKVHQELIVYNESAGLESASAAYDSVEAKKNSMLEQQLQKSLAKSVKDLVSTKVCSENCTEDIFAFSDPYDVGFDIPEDEIPKILDGLSEEVSLEVENSLNFNHKATTFKKREPGSKERLVSIDAQLSKVFEKPDVSNVFELCSFKMRPKRPFSKKQSPEISGSSVPKLPKLEPKTLQDDILNDAKKQFSKFDDGIFESSQRVPPSFQIHKSDHDSPETLSLPLLGSVSPETPVANVAIFADASSESFSRGTQSLDKLELNAYEKRDSGATIVSMSALNEKSPEVEKVKNGAPYLPFQSFKNLIFRVSADPYNDFEYFHTFQCKRISGKFSYHSSGAYILENYVSVYYKKLCRDCFLNLPSAIQKKVVTVSEPFFEGIAIERSKPFSYELLVRLCVRTFFCKVFSTACSERLKEKKSTGIRSLRGEFQKTYTLFPKKNDRQTRLRQKH